MAKTELNTAFGAFDKLNVQKILAIKTKIPMAKTAETCQFRNNPSKKHKPDKPTRINKGGETVINPNKNLFQLPNKPVSTKLVELGKFWK